MAPTRVTKTNGGVPEGQVTPEEAAAIRASVAGKEQAPSSRQQAVFSNWRQAADQLGSPFEVEHIPISKLRAMRRDPMLGFGLMFTKMPHIRAPWICNAKDNKGPNAQISAHADYDLRRVYPSLVFAYMNSLDFGFQATVKRFELHTPAGTFIETDPDTGVETEKAIWSQGNVEPIGFKPFVTLPPEGVNPNWNNNGELDGMNYKPPAGSAAPAGGGAGANADGSFDIDIFHTLWVTHERDANFGSIFGYPRLGYAYRYWWSYWFRWAIADRAFERKADPSVIVRHPEGAFIDDTGNEFSYSEYALLMGERMRSGGVIAIPSDVYEDATGKGTVPMWDIAFTQDATNFDPFDKSFEYIDVQKLRSLFIPEQAFFEGKGGTSSRNVAATNVSSFTESQAVLSADLVATINRWILPQWLAVNYPDFAANGGVVTMITRGFSDEDVEFTREIVQLIGQQPEGAAEISRLADLKQILERAGTPLATFADQKRKEASQQQALAQQGAVAPPATSPIAGQQVGVVPSASSATGFSYIQPQEVLYLSDSGSSDFLDGLPDSAHYADKTVRSLAVQLWNLYRQLLSDEYGALIGSLGSVKLGDDDPIGPDEAVELADFGRQARLIINKLKSSDRWPAAFDRTSEIFRKILKRAARLELKSANLSGSVADPDIDDWISSHIAELSRQVTTTTRNEIRDFVSARLSEGKDLSDIATLAKQHFSDFPDWKANRLVRTEIRDVYNGGTLLAAQAAAVPVQAEDAQAGDSDPVCEERDGKIFDVEDAIKEDEHPNGTLGWKLVPATNFSIERFERVEDEPLAWYSIETQTVHLADEISRQDERDYLKAVVGAL